MPIEADDLVDEVMRSHPTTIRVVLDFKMSCAGRPIACFHAVSDVCVEFLWAPCKAGMTRVLRRV